MPGRIADKAETTMPGICMPGISIMPPPIIWPMPPSVCAVFLDVARL
jgi:hypothetical protein